MTTPNSHNDTYAGSAHRMFFSNLQQGKDPSVCPDNDGHNVDSICALTFAVPVILKYAESDPQTRNEKVLEAIHTVRNIKQVEKYAILLSDLLVSVLNGKPLRDACQDTATQLGFGSLQKITEQSKSDPMVACYIDSSFPALLFIVYKYADSFEKAILANANAGGENVARGALVGALLGASHGVESFPDWTSQLHQKDIIMQEIDNFV